MSQLGLKEAMFYEKSTNNKVQCHLCPHQCKIAQTKAGICGVRQNKDGILYTLVYGQAVAADIDPIEKKPLYHFYPGSTAYSIATVGCNLRCSNCQNYHISQMPRDSNRITGTKLSPEAIVRDAKRRRCQSIAYTYTEPTIFYEYAYDTALLARQQDIKNVFVTNGYINPDPLRKIASVLDAANIDLKSFSEEFYVNNCGGHLQPVLDAIKLYHELGVWIEITTLVIPGLNDSDQELRNIAEFIVNISPSIPWHVSQFYPTYKLTDHPPTPVKTLERAREIGQETGLRYIYIGNVPRSQGENTNCYKCGKTLITRLGYNILNYEVKNGKCPQCGVNIDGIGYSSNEL